MPATTIRVRFIRKNSLSKNDDIVIIRRLGMNQFNLSYTYGDTNARNTHKLALTDKAVFRWMRSTINLLEKDNDPFDSVQVDFPFMPSVIFDVSKLDSAYNALLDALEFHLDNWPSSSAGRTPILNPEDDDAMEEDYDEEYADMPPLVPVRPQSPTPRGRHHLFLD